ncbi:hypothetical protein ACHAWX_000823 [Stephanocyclus meneghinianus]
MRVSFSIATGVFAIMAAPSHARIAVSNSDKAQNRWDIPNLNPNDSQNCYQPINCDLSGCTSGCNCYTAKCDMPACTSGCNCVGGHCDQSACTENCTCFGGWCDQSKCTKSCGCSAGHCDQSSCTENCDCAAGSCGPETDKYEDVIASA